MTETKFNKQTKKLFYFRPSKTFSELTGKTLSKYFSLKRSKSTRYETHKIC